MTSIKKEDCSPALKRELDRLDEYAAKTRAGHQDSAQLTSKHVEGLAGILRPAVEKALREETQAVMAADEWVAEAKTLASWLARTAPAAGELPEPGKDSGRPSGGWLSRLRGARFETAAVESQTGQALAQALEKKLTSGDALEATEAEVTEHSTDLARLLISNWFGVLEDAVEERPAEAVELAYRVFPLSVPAHAVTEGCEGFAPPVEQAVKALLEYQSRLAKPGEHVALSPLVSLYHSRNGTWYAFPSDDQRALEELRSREPQPIKDALEVVVSRATEAFSPAAISRGLQLQGGLIWDAAMMRQVSIQSAALVHARMHSGSDVEGGAFAESMPMERRDPLADLVLSDLEAMVQPGYIQGSNLAQSRLSAVFSERDLDVSAGDVYMAAMPCAAALISGNWAEAFAVPVEVDLGAFEEPEVRLITAAAEVVSMVVDASNANPELGPKLRDLMDPEHEPSKFGLLGP